MIIDTMLSFADQMLVRATLADYMERFQVQHALERLLIEWEQFVGKVEREYEGSIFEYTNDLSTRTLLERVEHIGLSADGLAQIQRRLAPLDERFRNATSVLPCPLVHRPGWLPGWWYYRIPHILGTELQEDLCREGVIPRTS